MTLSKIINTKVYCEEVLSISTAVTVPDILEFPSWY